MNKFILGALATLAIAGCDQSSSIYDAEQQAMMDRQYMQQLADYDRQSETTDRQLRKLDEQAARFDALLDRWEQQAERQDQILDAQEAKAAGE